MFNPARRKPGLFGESLMFGTLIVTMFVQSGGREKAATLARIPCDYDERAAQFREFLENNPHVKQSTVHAEFVLRERVPL